MQKKKEKREREEDIEFWEQYSTRKRLPFYATYNERKRMAIVNPKANKELTKFMLEEVKVSKDRVLEPGFGGGEVTVDVLKDIF